MSPFNSATLGTAADTVGCARHLFADWDGCLVDRGSLSPGAARLLRIFSGRVSILSNNSTNTPAGLGGFLARRGLYVPPERILLAGDLTLRRAARTVGSAGVCLLANAEMHAYARTLGLRLRERHARHVILLRDTTFTFEKLARAVALLHAGATLTVSNVDRTHPRGAGVTPETGALLAAIGACVDLDALDVTIVGKPQALLFQEALAHDGLTPDDVVMIGDGRETDIEGATRLGIRSVLIDGASGVTVEALSRALAARGQAAAAGVPAS